MQLNMSNKQEYIQTLYQQGKFDTMLTFATQEMEQALAQHSYKQALDFYEHIIVSTYNLGKLQSFTLHLSEFEKLCQLYGTTHHWMQYYRYFAMSQFFQNNYSLALESGKRAIHYAFQLKDYKVIAICYGGLSALYSLMNQQQPSSFAMKLAQHYSKYIQHDRDALLRVNSSILFYYAQTKQLDLFIQLHAQIKQQIAHRPLYFYQAKLYLLEGKLRFDLGQHEESRTYFEKGLAILREHKNLVYIQYVLNFIQHNHSTTIFPTEYIQGELKYVEQTLTDSKDIQLQLLEESLQHLTQLDSVAEPNLPLTPMSKLGHLVNKQLHDQKLVVISFSLTQIGLARATTPVQFVYTAFSIILDLLAGQYFICTQKTNVEGVLILKETPELEHILYKIHQNIRKLTMNNKVEDKQLPIHFGLAYSSQLENATFDQLYIKSNAALYYAQTNNKLYII